MRLAILLLVPLTTLAPMTQAPQDRANASIEGIIVSAANNLPLEGVRVRIGPRPGSPYDASEYPDIPAQLTGPDGKFLFSGLKAAVYGLVLDANGYVPQAIGFTRYGSELQEGEPIPLNAGQSIKGVTVKMTRTGTITGRIREADSRQPVAGVTVQLLHPEYGVTGERTLRTVDTVRTNDRGEYRLYFVTPGRYYIGAGGDQRRTGRTSLQNTLQNNSNQIPVDYAAAFYPGVTNTPNATMVEVRPDAEVAAIDFFVRKHALYRIRGRVLDSTSGQPPAAATFSLFRQADVRWERVEIVNNYRSSDGSFTLTGLVPGSYSIVVSARRSAPRGIALPATPTGPRVVRVGFQVVQSRPAEDAPGYAQKATAVEIVGSDVDGVTIPVSPGVLLEGRLGVESGIIPNNLDSLAVSMRSLDRLVTTTSRTSAIGTPGERTLRFNDVAPGDYRVSVSGLPAGFYAKQATFAGADVLQRVMRVASGDVNRLNVVISSSVASLDGIVRNERSDAVAGSAVVLIPDERDRTELFQRVKTGSDGRFTFPAIAPGSYKVFAWETLESYAYFDAELVRQVEQSGKAIQLGESARQSVELKIIPAN